MIRKCIILVAALLPLPVQSENSLPVVAVLEGIADVRDGDGLLFGRVEIRLQGIAAPEDRRGRVDPMGKAATAALERLALGRMVTCHLDGTTAGRSGRPVAICRVDGMDLGREMVRQGFARDCPAYSLGRYHLDEMKARQDGNNLSAVYDVPDYC